MSEYNFTGIKLFKVICTQFLNVLMIPKAMTGTSETLDFIKSKNCCALKDILEEVEKPYRTENQV